MLYALENDMSLPSKLSIGWNALEIKGSAAGGRRD
jgi:hypothetical protein